MSRCVSFPLRSLRSRVKVLVDGTLLIPNLLPEDAGNYTCVPTNGILTPPSASAHLKVKRKTMRVHTNDTNYNKPINKCFVICAFLGTHRQQEKKHSNRNKAKHQCHIKPFKGIQIKGQKVGRVSCYTQKTK